MQSDNRFGDMEITDPKAMRALAHPVRLAILERLQRHGPATATQLSPHVGATPSVASWHLRHLAGFGLVRDAVEGGADLRYVQKMLGHASIKMTSDVYGHIASETHEHHVEALDQIVAGSRS